MSNRTTSAFIAAAVAALTLAACGGGDGSGGGGKSDQEKFQEAALKHAECMRRHGIDVPDPKQGGGLVTNDESVPPDEMDRVMRACDKEVGKMPAPKLSEKEQREFREAALKHSRCMRKHGIDMPDPKFGPNGTVQIEIKPGQGPDDPAFQAAEQKCQKLLGNRGVIGAEPLN
jgi:hypothetical protein